MYNNEPKDDILHNWKISLPIREIAMLSPHEFFEQWPILKSQAAIVLVILLFSYKHNGFMGLIIFL